MKAVPVPSEQVAVGLTVNGERYDLQVPARRLLIDVLREDLGLTGTHAGCEHGICGACTVLLDGAPSRSCITLAVQADGAEITTVEGITPGSGLGAMQESFRAHHALQCGFCTPGILMTLAGVDPASYPDDASIREVLSGNLCRCTGYENIVAAVRSCWWSSTTIARLQTVIDELLLATGAGRTTLRLGLPEDFFPVVVESCSGQMRPIKGEDSVDLRTAPTFTHLEQTLGLIVHDDCANSDPPTPREVIENYDVRAQMLAAVARDGHLVGTVSVHVADGPRRWSTHDVRALERAVGSIADELATVDLEEVARDLQGGEAR